LAVNGAATLGTGASSYTFGGGSSTPSGLTDKDLTLKAWSPTSGTNEYSGDLILQSGVGTGNGSGKLGSVIIKVGTDGATSSTLGTYITSATFTKTGVGIGTSSPSAKLEVVGVDENLLKLRNGSGQPALVRFNDTSTTADPYVGSYGNDLAFGIYGVGESMRINSSRNVGIGTSSPSYKLDIRNDVGASTSLDPISIGLYNGNDGGSAIYFRNSVGGQSKISFGVEASGSGTDDTYLGFSNGQNTSLTERMRIASSGHVIVGSTTDSGYRFQVRGGSSYTQLIYQSGGSAGYIPLNITHNATSGTIELIQFNTDAAYVGYIRTNGSTCTFSGTALSDERFKENIKPIANALDVVSRIEFKEFNYTENKNESAGVIAQQLLNIPELSKFVNNGTDEDSFKTVDYNAIIGYLGKAIQELNQKVNEQQQTINSLINR
jgi:hypothetical protein